MYIYIVKLTEEGFFHCILALHVLEDSHRSQHFRLVQDTAGRRLECRTTERGPKLWHLTEHYVASMIEAGMDHCHVIRDGLLLTAENSAISDEEHLLFGVVALLRRGVWSVADVVAHGGQDELHPRDVGDVLVQSPEGVVASTLLHQFVVETHEAVYSLGVRSVGIETPIPEQTISLG